MRDAAVSVQSARCSAEPAGAGSSPFGSRVRRSELAGLCLRVAETLERSAELAERHAEHERRKGCLASAGVEVKRAERAREGARRGRALAARMQ
jgi:hypothetical protein